MTTPTPKGYVKPGVYIGEAPKVSTPVSTPDVRVATFVGRGSRYMKYKDQKLVRGFVYDHPVSFSNSAPHVAALSPASNGSTGTAVLVDGYGVEVRKDLWSLTADNTGIQIADSVYDPTASYYFSYQSNDRSVADPLPVDNVRVIEAVGSQVSADQYVRNRDYYIDTETVDPVPAVDDAGAVISHAVSAPVFSGVTKSGAGTGVVGINASALFTHAYSRAYSLKCVSTSGSVSVFAWSATPLSFGNESAPATPVAAGAIKPTFSIDTTNPQSLTVELEYGIRVDFSTGTYAVNDTFGFSVTAPSLIEVSGAQKNTNQYADSSTVVLDEDNTGTGSIVVDASGYSRLDNTKFVVEVLNVDHGVTVAGVPHGLLAFSGNPLDGEAFVIDNGQLGGNHVAKTIEFSSDSVQSIAGSIPSLLGIIAANPATATIGFIGTASQAPVDGDTVTITDGTRTFVFEFDADGVISNPANVRVLVDTTAGQQSHKTILNLLTAINASALNFTVTDTTSLGIGSLALTHNIAGALGNNKIVTSRPSFIAVSGFTGGTDVVADTATTINNTVAAINNAYPRLGIVAFKNTDSTIELIHGSRFVFAANPALGDVVTVNIDGVITAFEFDDGTGVGVGNVPVLVGGSLATTMGNLVTAINNASSNIIAVASSNGIATVTVAGKSYRSIVLTESSTAITVVGDVIQSNGYNNGNKSIVGIGALANLAISGMTGGVAAGDAPDIVSLAYGTAGDVFASGIVNVNELTADSSYVSLYAGVKIKLSKAIAKYAKGSLTLVAVPAIGDTVTIDDHINPAVTFTFAATAGAATDVVISSNLATTTTNLYNKIASAGLAVTPSLASSTSISLAHKRSGSIYNGGVSVTGSGISVVNLVGGGSNYNVGDKYTFTALAPRKFSTALDNRKVRLTVGTVGIDTPALSDPGYVMFGYTSNTPEGGFGTVESKSSGNGYFTLPGQIELVVRNATSFVKGDIFDVEYVNNNVVRWDLDKKTTETALPAGVLIDRNGAITGKAGSFYVNLRNVPYDGSVTAVQDGVAFTAFTLVSGTAIVILGIASQSEITKLLISYRHRGAEPNLGAIYYTTAQYLRPADYYNKPQVFYDRETARAFLEPVTLNNDLAIANEIAFDQSPKPQAVCFVQVLDSDDDGVFSPSDIDAAIAACMGVSYITDACLVNQPNYLDKFMAYDINANDPLEAKEHISYYGLPSGTALGSGLEEGSIVYTATKTLQVYGDSPAHGSRVLVGTTTAKKTITLSDKSTGTATLDGSFVAAGICALVAGLPDNASTILRKNLLGFDFIETFTEPENKILGGASVIYFEPNGSGVYKIMEDITVDSSDPEYQNIIAMRTKQDSVRDMRKGLDQSTVGYVAETKASGIGFVKAGIITRLYQQVGNGLIAQFQDGDGNIRQLSTEDVIVIRDAVNPNRYHFRYPIFTRWVVKELFGTYTTNNSAVTGTL